MSYTHFIGIDIAKASFEVAVAGKAAPGRRFDNSVQGFQAFFKAYAKLLPEALVVLESTGGYERALLSELVAASAACHRADPLTAKHFIRSLGHRGKTDVLDAKGLARYAQERHRDLGLFHLPEAEQDTLNALLSRRNDLVDMRVAETNRLKHPRYAALKASLEAVLETIREQITMIETQIAELIDNTKSLKQKFDVMTAVKGIGPHTAYALLAFMPELGTLTAKKAASLAGCAPHPRDSGNSLGYRRTWGGRAVVKRSLFLAAMAARRYNPDLRTFYNRLIANGKKPIVAITAIMRKLIVILNAKLRDAHA